MEKSNVKWAPKVAQIPPIIQYHPKSQKSTSNEHNGRSAIQKLPHFTYQVMYEDNQHLGLFSCE